MGEGRQRQENEVRIERVEGFRDIYANSVRVACSMFDCRIYLGQFEAGEQPTVLREHTGLFMSLEAAKSMTIAVMQQLKLWEEQNGEIVPKKKSDLVVPVMAMPKTN